MRKVHHKSLLLLVIWCLIGLLPRWGMVGSWIWLGVLILLAILLGSRKKEIPALFFIASFPAGLFDLEQLYYAGVPLKRIGRELDLNTFWSKFAQNQKHIAYTEGIAIALLIVCSIVGLGGFRSAFLFCLVIAILPLTLFAVYSFSLFRQCKTIDSSHSPELANRPAFDWDYFGQCNHLARHYSNVLEARYALHFFTRMENQTSDLSGR